MPVTGSYSSSPFPAPFAGEIPEGEKSAVQIAKDMLFVDTSVGKYLDAIGSRVGIPRPKLAPGDDDMYRLIIQALAWQPKTIPCTLHSLMTAVFGSRASFVAQSKRPWEIYEVNANEIIVEVPWEAVGTSNETSSYLHGFSGVVLAGATTTVFNCKGDARKAATSLVGLGCSAFISGAWEERTISTATYDAAADETTITVGSAFSGTPDGGAPFFVLVPEASAFRGDYLSPTWFAKGTATSVGVGILTDSGATMTVNAHAGRYLRLGNGAVYAKILSNTATTFTIDVAGVPPDGFYAVVATPFDALEASGGAFPPSSDRVYVTGMGLLEVVKEYMVDLKLVRASGVAVRFELVG